MTLIQLITALTELRDSGGTGETPVFFGHYEDVYLEKYEIKMAGYGRNKDTNWVWVFDPPKTETQPRCVYFDLTPATKSQET